MNRVENRNAGEEVKGGDRKAPLLLFIIFIFSSNAFSLELINANTNSNRFEDGAIVSTLSGSVEFLWNDTRIFADETIWRRGKGHLQMFGNIKVLRNRQELRCDTVEFRSDGKMLQLRGNVWGVDTNYCATMVAGKADYSIRNDSVFLSVKPQIHFWDSTNTDTITILSRTMNYTSKTGIARADKNVRAIGTDFTAFAAKGLYYAQTQKGLMLGEPRIEYKDESTVKGDTIHILFNENVLSEFFVVGKPIGDTRNIENGDSVFMELTGDTLRFVLGDGKLDRIVAQENAIVERFTRKTADRRDKMWGQQILTDVNCTDCGDGNTVSSVVSGNSKAIYYDSDVKNESAGDSIKLFFGDDGVSRVQILGKVKGRLEN